MTQRPYMPMNWGDYLRDNQGLTTLEHGAYLLLIAYYWNHGCLPETYVQCQNVTGLTRRTWPRVWHVLRHKFTPDRHHVRLDRDIEKVENLKLKRRFAGEHGASRRWQMPQAIAKPKAMAKAMAIAGVNKNKIATLNTEPREEPMLPDDKLKPSPDLEALIRRQNGERPHAGSLASALPNGRAHSPALAASEGLTNLVKAKGWTSPSDEEQCEEIPFDLPDTPAQAAEKA